MTGNFGITVSVMLGAGIAAALSKRLTYGSIYTTKLLRRGIDIERPRATAGLESLTVADVMQPFAEADGGIALAANGAGAEAGEGDSAEQTLPSRAGATELWQRLVGPVTASRQPQALFAEEDLEQALRQLVLYGRDGLPVLSHDGQLLCGWITRNDVLRVLGERVRSSAREIEQGALAAGFASDEPESRLRVPSTPLRGYEIVELAVGAGSPALGRRLGEIAWPPACLAVAVTQGREVRAARGDIALHAGERIILLAPSAISSAEAGEEDLAAGHR